MEVVASVNGEKFVCRSCGVPKSRADFGKCVTTANKLQPNCRTCQGALMLAGKLRKGTNITIRTADINRVNSVSPTLASVRPKKVRANGDLRAKYAKPTVKPSAPSISIPSVQASPSVIVPPTAAPERSQSQFINVGTMLVNVSNIAFVDSTGDAVEVVLNVHDMNRQGVVTARVFSLTGIERDLFMAQLSIVSGQPVVDFSNKVADLTAKLDRVSAELVDATIKIGNLESVRDELLQDVEALKVERDAAMQLASELEANKRRMLAMLAG